MPDIFGGMMPINWHLFPLKVHYALFNSATGSLVPYLTTYVRQLGYSTTTIGTIFFIFPIFGLFAKPLFGYIADKFKIHKQILIGCLLLTLLSFSNVPVVRFLKESVPKKAENKIPVGIECHDSTAILTSCYPPESNIDQCKINHVGYINKPVTCNMQCNMTNSAMWQNHCDVRSKNAICLAPSSAITFKPTITKVDNRSDCMFFSPISVFGKRLGPEAYPLYCNQPFVDIDCGLICDNEKLKAMLRNNIINFKCYDMHLHVTVCSPNHSPLSMTTYKKILSNDLGTCHINCGHKDNILLEDNKCTVQLIHENHTCHEKRSALVFDSIITPKTISFDSNCISFDIDYIETQYEKQYINCPKTDIIKWRSEYWPQCATRCNDEEVNALLRVPEQDSYTANNELGIHIWLLCTFLALSWIGQSVIVTFSDAICFDILGPNSILYGKQRLWGSAGWGIFSLVTGILIDYMSEEGITKNYTIAFVFMGILLVADILVVWKQMKVQSPHVSLNIIRDVGAMVQSLPTILFLLWAIPVGICTGLLWQFHFFLIEDVARQNCEEEGLVKTIQGLVTAIQMFGGEIPAMFVSGRVLLKIGHHNMMSLILLAFGLRYFMYSFVYNPWWFLPLELLHALTIGAIYPTMASYAHIVAPRGTEATVQGIVGAIFEGVGASLGSYIGGQLYDVHGGAITFRYFGYFAFVVCVLHAILIKLFKKSLIASVPPELIPVVYFIRTPEDMRHIVDGDTI